MSYLTAVAFASALSAISQGQDAPSVPLMQPHLVPTPGYIQKSDWANMSLSFPPGSRAKRSEYHILADIRQQYGGFGQRWTSPRNWAQHDALVFTITNLESRDINIALQVEGNREATIKAANNIFIPAGATTRVSFDIAPDKALQNGLWGLPPALMGEHVRAYAYNQLDLSKIYGWWIYSLEPLPMKLTVTNFRLATRQAPFVGYIDGFGQYSRDWWPGKVGSTDELPGRLNAERTELANNPGPGGYTGTTQLPAQAPGKWRTFRSPSGKWYLVHPSGRLFWSMGISGVSTKGATKVNGRESMFQSLPPNGGSTADFYSVDANENTLFDFLAYNISRKFGSNWRNAYVEHSLTRLKSWGFNTIGPWSDPGLAEANQLPYTITLNTKAFPTKLSTPFAYWNKLPDAFAPDFQSYATDQFTQGLVGHNGRTNFMGVFVDSEPSWSGGDTPHGRYQVGLGAINANSTQPAKVAFLAQLQGKYGNIGAFNSAWGTSYSSWGALQQPNTFNRSTLTAACQDDLRIFVLSFARAYYSKVKAALAAANLSGLYLGSRDAWPTPETIQAATENVDVYSATIYRLWQDVDWNFPQIGDKPIMIDEFSYGSTDRGSFHPGHILVKDQAARGKEFLAYAKAAAQSKKVVGITWFQYADNPTSGRGGDGENYNMGFVSIADTPYPELVSASRSFGQILYSLRGY